MQEEHVHGPECQSLNSRFGFVSTSTTTIDSTKYKTSLNHLEGEFGVSFNGHIFQMMVHDKFSKDEPDVIDLISDKPKVLMPITTSYYHLYHDNFGEFLTQYELTPDAQFIIDITHISETNPLPEYIKMIFKFLNDNKVDYKPINLNKFNKVNINNFYFRNFDVESLAVNDPSNKIRKHMQSYIKNKDLPANKKVFLSRKNFTGRDLSVLIKGRLPYENDNRIDDEKMLQDYFKSLGFEIVVPEDFKKFEDQIEYFDKVKVLISTTSSGFTNAMFMRPGGTMVELETPLISFGYIGNGVTQAQSQGQQEIHHFYHAMGIALDHYYIGIPNKTREAKKIIQYIENNKSLKVLLSEDVS